MDYASIASQGSLAQCRSCSLIFNPEFAAPENHVRDVMKSETYASSRVTQQTLRVNGFSSPVTRMCLQVELLLPLLKTENPGVLDIGCFDGSFLEALSRRKPAGFFHGYDINEHVRNQFPRASNLKFSSGDLGTVGGSYDLVVLSHSLMYLDDLSSLFSDIRRLLKPRGVLFIQTPDVSKNPWSLLFADQFSFYSRENLTRLFAQAGFSVHLIESGWFPRELLAYGQQTAISQVHSPATSVLGQCLMFLDAASRLLREASDSAPRSPLAVLGTTVNAAWAHSILGDRLGWFVDEDSQKIGRDFRHTPVIHPAELQEDCMLVIPYRESSERIKQQFETKYPNIVTYLCV